MPVPAQGVGAAGSEVQILTDPELRQRERDNIVAALTKSGWRIHGPGGAAELLTKMRRLQARSQSLSLAEVVDVAASTAIESIRTESSRARCFE